LHRQRLWNVSTPGLKFHLIKVCREQFAALLDTMPIGAAKITPLR